MKYEIIESSLETNKSRDYLWNKINTPEKVIQIEQFKDTKVKKISDHNFEFYFGERFGFMTFIPKTSVNLTFFLDNDSSIAWFDIKGDENCILVHGTSVRIDDDNRKWVIENKERIKEHFLEELSKIAK